MSTPDPAAMIAHSPHDMGGQPEDAPIDRTERELSPFEKRCHALLTVLEGHRIINTEEKRRGVEDLGAQIIANLSYYQRWSVSAAKVLNEKGIVTTAELGGKMTEIRQRLTVEAAP